MEESAHLYRLNLFNGILSLAVLVTWGVCQAASRNYYYPELKEGMSYFDVVKLWGPAPFKIQYETKRQDAWQYGVAKVVFHEGKVIDWQTGEKAKGGKSVPPEVFLTPPENTEEQKQAQALLDEILREIPSEAETSGKLTGATESSIPGISSVDPKTSGLAQPIMPLKDREFPE